MHKLSESLVIIDFSICMDIFLWHLTTMIVQIRKASVDQKPILERLMQMYLHDFSEIDPCDVNDDGIFQYKYFDHYWTEPDRIPFLIYVENKIAGFVLINDHSHIFNDRATHVIAEFFVMRKYRRHGIGTNVAQRIFEMFPGKWEVPQTENNRIAQAFWRKVIHDYTNGNYKEIHLDTDSWKGPVQTFTTT